MLNDYTHALQVLSIPVRDFRVARAGIDDLDAVGAMHSSAAGELVVVKQQGTQGRSGHIKIAHQTTAAGVAVPVDSTTLSSPTAGISLLLPTLLLLRVLNAAPDEGSEFWGQGYRQHPRHVDVGCVHVSSASLTGLAAVLLSEQTAPLRDD